VEGLGLLHVSADCGDQVVVADSYAAHLEPRMFSTWAPAAIVAIGKLPDTLNDRAVPCRMHRRKPGERIMSFRIDRTDDLVSLARKAARWAADSEEFLRKADPDVGSLSNRIADNWRPLLAIAEAAGGGMADPNPGGFCESGIQG
jgi:Protein of unknown function (DUF3631)